MSDNDKAEIIKMLTGTFEAMGQASTPAGLLLIADDLAPYGLAAVAGALVKCRKELSGRLTPAEIIKRIVANDGRPEPNEAWSIALQGADERDTVVTNDEIAYAFGACSEILYAGDEVGARMAFIEAYRRVVADAREKGVPLKWWPSLGQDKSRREFAVQRAVELGRLTQSQVHAALPHLANEQPEMSLENLLTGPAAKANPEKARSILQEMKGLFEKTKVDSN